MLYFFQQSLNGLQVSIHYALLAVAYVLVHAITKQANLVFGSLATWAGYIVINWALVLMLLMPGKTALPVILAVIVAIVSTMALGYLIGRIVIRPLARQGTLSILIASLGLAIVLEEFMRLANHSREVWLMPILNEPLVLYANPAFPLQLTTLQVLILSFAFLLAIGVASFIKWHSFGRAWRAAADDLAMAELCGINTGWLVIATFVIATTLAATSGALIAIQYGSITFYGGLIMSLKTLFVAIVGGLSSVGGACAGALLLGMTETMWSAYFDLEYRDAMTFLALSLLMVLFPTGIFGQATDAGRV